MTVHSVYICSASKKTILFSKLFTTRPDSVEASTFEHRLLVHTEPYWQGALSDGLIQSLIIGSVYVVLQVFGSVMIILCGLHDIDEPILADIMLCLQLVLTETLNGCRHESSLTDVENYAKLTILVDEIVSQGLIECLDPVTVIAQSKLKN